MHKPMAHCTLEDLTSDWFDESAHAADIMPKARSIRNILSYSAGLRTVHSKKLGVICTNSN
jgi:predicted transcriptional regulator YheO